MDSLPEEEAKHQARYFVGIGAQKAGTTWLHDQLALHPQVCLPRRKELHYFDMAYDSRGGQPRFGWFLRQLETDIRALKGGPGNEKLQERALTKVALVRTAFSGGDDYVRLIEQDRTPETRVCGEICPSYATLAEEGLHQIRSVLDAPKVIFAMRDPLERYWSAVRMQADPYRTERVFRDAIHRPADWNRCDYEATIRLVDRLWPTEDVLYLFYEDLFSEDSLRTVAEFLGVTPEWEWDIDLKSNVGHPVPIPSPPDVVLELLAPVYDFVRRRFGERVPEAWGRGIR